MNKVTIIKEKYLRLKDTLNERSRRLWAASEAMALGHGGIEAVFQATQLSRSTISRGIKEFNKSTRTELNSEYSIRRKGGGRKRVEDLNKNLIKELELLVESDSRGDPESPLRWTTKSTRKLAESLFKKGYKISHVKVASMLKTMNFSLQATRKVNEGKSHKDRDLQFKYINSKTVDFQNNNLPVVSVDAKKKELVGKFSNNGKEYHKKGSPEEVNVYDFISYADGKVTPYGVYDISNNQGWVNVGISKDTAQFAVSTLRNWWYEMGKTLYPDTNKLLVHADGGGSNGYRNRLWKQELQKLANETALEITVCHFPPGTSKWNKIEHRLFSQISKNWRGRPLETFEIIVNLIGQTTTKTGLIVKSEIDLKEYETGIKISNEELKKINIEKHSFHGDDWNYTIKPNE